MAERKKKATETAAENQESEAVDTYYQKQLPRLRRIEGQVRGLQKMIETKRYCLDITHQISAIINSLRRVQNDMLHEHLAALGEQIISENLSPQARGELANEISEHLKNLS